MAHVLIVDDEVNIRRVLAAMLKREGYEVTTAADGEQALAVLQKTPVHVVVTDLVMPRMGGMELLRRVALDFPDVPVIVITAHGSVDSAVAALKAGAFDYITKPFEQDELKNVIAKAARAHDLERQNVHANFTDGDRPPLVGESPGMKAIYDIVAKVADSPSTVLITGESGTGKELIAKALHRGSSRRDKPLIKVNCAAIPKDLVESELFGYEKGAFTGAVGSKPGRFELADGGTLFLDEIGEMPVEMQVKLLRALQESEFERVGGIKTIHVDVRLIAATNRDLKQLIADGKFREDLYYRLAVVPIELPPLRERREDIPLLVRHFIQKYDERLGKRVEGIEDDALQLLIELRLAREHPRAGEPDGAIGAVRRRAAHPRLGAPRLAARARAAASRPDRGGGPPRRDRGAERRLDEGDRPPSAGRAREGAHRARARGDRRERHPRREAAADQPQVAAGEDEGARAARHRGHRGVAPFAVAARRRSARARLSRDAARRPVA